MGEEAGVQQMEIRRVTPLAARASPDHGLNPFLSAASFVFTLAASRRARSAAVAAAELTRSG